MLFDFLAPAVRWGCCLPGRLRCLHLPALPFAPSSPERPEPGGCRGGESGGRWPAERRQAAGRTARAAGAGALGTEGLGAGNFGQVRAESGL